MPLAWSDGAVAVRVHVHPLPWPPVAVGEEGSPACRLRKLSPHWHLWVLPVPSFLALSISLLLHPPARGNERGGHRTAVVVTQPSKSCPLFSHPCVLSSLVNVPVTRPGSGTLLPLAAVKRRAGEETHGCTGKEKDGRGRGSSLSESGSAGDDALRAQMCRQEEARAALITALLRQVTDE